MTHRLRPWVLTGGVINLLLALFHVFLCYKIFRAFGSKPFYPLMQMFGIGGTIMVFFLAYTSLFQSGELLTTKVGRAVLALNVAIYFTRVLGEWMLFPKPSPLIIGLCLGLAVLYGFLLNRSAKGSVADQSQMQ